MTTAADPTANPTAEPTSDPTAARSTRASRRVPAGAFAPLSSTDHHRPRRRFAATIDAPEAARPFRRLLAPVVGSGLLLSSYLVLRPYGDAGNPTTLAAAQAFASNRWVAAHLCGALGLASVGRLALRLDDAAPSALARVARWTGLVGSVLVLPYYGAEMFALHVIGRRALGGDLQVLAMVEQIRNQPVALATFGLGLLLLAVCGISIAVRWQRLASSWRWAAWPLGVLIALVLPQFYLPPTLRVAFGVAVAAASALFTAAIARAGRTR